MTLAQKLQEEMDRNRITEDDLAREARMDAKKVRRYERECTDLEIALLLDAADRIIERKTRWKKRTGRDST